MSQTAWVQSDVVDTDTVARLASLLAPHFRRNRVHNSAAESALVIEATIIFQELHFSFDPDYWDQREYPMEVAGFAIGLITAFECEPSWVNMQYVANREGLRDLLLRWPHTVE